MTDFFQIKQRDLNPYTDCLKKNTPFEWTSQHKAAVQYVKEILSSDCVLTFYDPKKPLSLAVDASDYGVAAVLSHINAKQEERPIAFASRTLTPTERRYDPFNKEACALIFGITKFNKYIYGRSGLTIYTDHKPLVGFFKPHAPTPQSISPRLLRWSLILGAYDYKIIHRPGKKNGNADALSRLPLPYNEALGIHLLELSSGSPVTRIEIAKATADDQVLSAVYAALSSKWPNPIPAALQPYHNVCMELSTIDNCILRGNRVIIPAILQDRVLTSLHAAHHGLTKMKEIAKSFVWWPRINTQLINITDRCVICQEHRRNPHCTYRPWPVPTKHWERVHIDYAEINGQYFFLMVDAWSRWPEIFVVNSLSAAELIRCTRYAFATHGVPELIVSDNGRQLVSTDFNNFLARNGTKHLTSAPYFPQSNGLAERHVGIFKGFMKKMTEGNWHDKTARTLFAMRITPSTATGEAPSERVFNHPLRTPWECMRPEKRNNIQHNISQTKFLVGQPVNFRDHRHTAPKFSQGTIIEILGNRMYKLIDKIGTIHTRNTNQLHPRPPDEQPFNTKKIIKSNIDPQVPLWYDDDDTTPAPPPLPPEGNQSIPQLIQANQGNQRLNPPSIQIKYDRPQRERCRPNWHSDFVF